MTAAPFPQGVKIRVGFGGLRPKVPAPEADEGLHFVTRDEDETGVFGTLGRRQAPHLGRRSLSPQDIRGDTLNG